jgi:hypothetical protein
VYHHPAIGVLEWGAVGVLVTPPNTHVEIQVDSTQLGERYWRSIARRILSDVVQVAAPKGGAALIDVNGVFTLVVPKAVMASACLAIQAAAPPGAWDVPWGSLHRQGCARILSLATLAYELIVLPGDDVVYPIVDWEVTPPRPSGRDSTRPVRDWTILWGTPGQSLSRKYTVPAYAGFRTCERDEVPLIFPPPDEQRPEPPPPETPTEFITRSRGRLVASAAEEKTEPDVF